MGVPEPWGEPGGGDCGHRRRRRFALRPREVEEWSGASSGDGSYAPRCLDRSQPQFYGVPLVTMLPWTTKTLNETVVYRQGCIASDMTTQGDEMGERSAYDQAVAARTHRLFREVNERVRDINAEFTETVALNDWVCECASKECRERILLTTEEYEEVRANPLAFAVAPTDDHVFQQIEDVVARNERYWVVQKKGQLEAMAQNADEVHRQGGPATNRTTRRRSATPAP
jgi:hypothetical protein